MIDTSVLQLPSPIQTIQFEGHSFSLKRDDLIHPDFSGNKARKLHYFLQHDLPHVRSVVSYGSIQSNAMYSLSVLAKHRGWRFEYHVDHIPDYLKENPHGNYRAALKNGMHLIVGADPVSAQRFGDDTLFIQEGGRQKEAAYGIEILAQEIEDWQKIHGIERLNIFLPSGTGTTAFFLQKHLVKGQPQGAAPTVYTCPCVGDDGYLKKQFEMLEEDVRFHPRIISLGKKHHFGKLYRENYEIWLKLQQQTGVTFDLLYDPLGWRTLLAHPKVMSKPTLYLHQGGLLGNESMLPRYERKYSRGIEGLVICDLLQSNES